MGALPERMGNAHADFAPHGVYRCRGDDAWIAIAVQDEAEWATFRRIVGADWCADPRYRGLANRIANRDALDAGISAWTASRDSIALAEELQRHGIGAGPVYKAPELLADSQNVAREYFTTLEASQMEAVPYPGLPLKIDGGRGTGYWPAPRLGEHNREVLADVLGMSAVDIDALERDSVLYNRPPES